MGIVIPFEANPCDQLEILHSVRSVEELGEDPPFSQDLQCPALLQLASANIVAVDGDFPLLQLAVAATTRLPNFDKWWQQYMPDLDLSSTPVHLASDEIGTTEAGDTFVSLFRAYHKIYDLWKEPDTKRSTEVVRRTTRIEKVTEHL